jgi:drug/metabolite transporter (DMT)-like permease
MKGAKAIVQGIGIVSIILALLGLSYNVCTIFGDYSNVTKEHNQQYFYPAFYIMSSICIICYLIILICGIQYVRIRTKIFPLFLSILIFEIVYFFSVGFMWLIPQIGHSVAGATGVSNGGMVFQFITLFPIWAPIIVAIASRKITKSAEILNKTDL